ncbi:laccase [Geranomyces michiganensis]|nr:laccase [Geranomyces michiganensis]
MYAYWLLSALSISSAAAVTIKYTLDIVNGPTAPDGYKRQAVLVNGAYPGTTIYGSVYDDFELTVNNMLTDPNMDLVTAVHWHGFFQNNTIGEDGPASVNQCPITPGSSYTYKFSPKEQSGTFWYHSHFHAQYVDGLKGVVVVYDPDDPQKDLYDVDDENSVIQLSDWYRQSSKMILLPRYLSPGGSEPKPDSALINGRGGSVAPTVFPVTSGKRYRYRIVNVSAMSSFIFSIDGHEFDVIEVDSIAHKATRASQLTIHAGQRYSVVVKAGQAVGNYWVRAVMTNSVGTQNALAIMRYAGAPAVSPSGTGKAVSAPALTDDMLHPFFKHPILGNPKVKADIDVYLDFDKRKNAAGVDTWFINGVEFMAPDGSLLYDILTKGATTKADFPLHSNVQVITKPMAIVDIHIKGGQHGFRHPFHLHGHAFSVMTASNDNPVMRDVEAIGGKETVLRFIADNPGTWFLHCHIDWHLEDGLAVVWIERPEDIRKNYHPSKEWMDLCPKYEQYLKLNPVKAHKRRVRSSDEL